MLNMHKPNPQNIPPTSRQFLETLTHINTTRVKIFDSDVCLVKYFNLPVLYLLYRNDVIIKEGVCKISSYVKLSIFLFLSTVTLKLEVL
jgi:hypothetical protein